MPDNWQFVAGAYGLAVLVLGGYWRRLVRLERKAKSAGTRLRKRARRLARSA